MTTPNVLQNIQGLVQQAAEVATVDMSQTNTGGGGEQIVLEKGNYLARFIEYVEKGSQLNFFDASKPAAPKVRLGFAVFPFETRADGTRGVSDNAQFIRTSDLNISNHEKATLKGIYNRLNYRNDSTKTHVAMFLGEAFLLGIDKKQNKAKTRFYNTIDTNDIKPALDPMSGQPYAVPNVDDSAYKVFLWDNPTQETWDSLYIDGERDDGTSRNFIQEEILGATDYPGSALQQLLEGATSIPAPDAEEAPWEEPAAPVEAPAAPAAPAVPTAPAVPEAPAVPAAPAVPQA